MTPFDYAVLAIVVLSLAVGLWRGLVSELLALVAWIAALLAAYHFAAPAGVLFSGWLRDPATQTAAGFVLVFFAVVALAALLRFLLRELLKAAGLGLADRTLGACFGVLRGVLIVLALVLVGGLTSLPRQPWWQEAMFAPPLETAVIAAKPWLPAAVARKIRYR